MAPIGSVPVLRNLAVPEVIAVAVRVVVNCARVSTGWRILSMADSTRSMHRSPMSAPGRRAWPSGSGWAC